MKQCASLDPMEMQNRAIRCGMIDDEPVDAITENVSQEATLLAICDCCHSGTLLDATNKE